MPPDVNEAKRIRRLIIDKCEGVTGSEEEAFALEDVVNDDELEEDEGNGNFIEEEASAVDVGVEGNAIDDAIVAIQDSGNRNANSSQGTHETTAASSFISPRSRVS